MDKNNKFNDTERKTTKKNSFRNFLSNELWNYPVPDNLNYLFSVGSVVGLLFIMQCLTGIFLAMHYEPHGDLAFDSVQEIMVDVEHGSTIRYMHSNGASFIFMALYIHMAKGLFYKSYTYDRRYIWWSGLIIFLLMMATAFLGYILPWGQMSFWGATVITNLVTAVPYVGESIRDWLWGGYSVGTPTVTRFYSLHYLLPLLTLGAIFFHLLALHRYTSTGGPQFPTEGTKITFHPYYTYKDAVAFLFTLLIFFFFVYFEPNYLGHPENYDQANPFVTPEHIVPEWYFTPFYAILRTCPDKVGGVVAMVASILIWGIMPLCKINVSTRNVYESEPHKFFFILFVAAFVGLIYLGCMPPTYYYLIASRAFTMYYFLYFIMIIPNLYLLEGDVYYSQQTGEVITRK